jgi:predicted peptidase
MLQQRATWPVLSSLLIGLVLLTGCRSGEVARSTAHFPPGTGFVRHHVLLDEQPEQVWVFIPKHYQPGQRYPTILFLHGLFEAGRNDYGALSAGLGPVIAKGPDDWPFITIFPQSTGTWRGEARERLAIAALNSVEAKWSVDRDRVTLAGLSFGGLGVWEIGAKHPGRFSALVPVAGPRATEVARRIVLLPIWAFNFRGDLVVSSDGADDMCEQITAHGGNAKQTKFDGMGHDCWDKAVAESDLIDWMLEQRISARAQTVATPAVADVR